MSGTPGSHAAAYRLLTAGEKALIIDDRAPVDHFVAPINTTTHRARCTACGWQTPLGTGTIAAHDVNFQARGHTIESGHETRVDATGQHGFRIRGGGQ